MIGIKILRKLRELRDGEWTVRTDSFYGLNAKHFNDFL